MKTDFDSTERSNEKSNLTIDELRKFKGFENSTDEEAKQQIVIIEKLAKILLSLFTVEQNDKNENEIL